MQGGDQGCWRLQPWVLFYRGSRGTQIYEGSALPLLVCEASGAIFVLSLVIRCYPKACGIKALPCRDLQRREAMPKILINKHRIYYLKPSFNY